MMRVQVITLFPEMMGALRSGIPGRAQEKNQLEVSTQNPRDFTTDPHRTVDDRPYGGGPGMVMMPGPLQGAIEAAKANLGADTPVYYLSPQGRRFDQKEAEKLAQQKEFILLCGRYEGVDQRLLDTAIDGEYSVGDYVLSGGELAAMTLIDACIRLCPDVLGDAKSAQEDSFSTGLLDHPHYTRPATFAGHAVPGVLLRGDHAAIARWRKKQALGRTWLYRSDLLKSLELNAIEKALLDEFIDEHQAEADDKGAK